ncbi:hypothetical protein BGZ65_002283, partial [Modicella reniformis]
AKDYNREHVWNEYIFAIDVVNQPGKNICEPDESVKDVVLALQETFPPLFPWDSSNPERRSPKLASLINNFLVSFLRFDAERTIQILQKTSWQARGDNLYFAHIPVGLHENKKARTYWSHRDSDDVLREYWLNLIAVGHGELVKNGALPLGTLFRCCRGSTVESLVHAALVLLDSEEFKTYSAGEQQSKNVRLENILKFATVGINNLIARATGCSTKEDRVHWTTTFHNTLRELLTKLFSRGHTALRLQEQHDIPFLTRFNTTLLDPLLGSIGVFPRLAFPPLGQHIFEQIQNLIFKPKFRKEYIVSSIVERLLAILAPRDTSVYTIPDDGYKPCFSAIPAWNNEAVFQTCVAGCLNRTDEEKIQLNSTWIRHFSNLGPSLTSSQRDKVVQWITALPTFRPLIGKDQGIGVAPMLESLCTNTDLRHQLVSPLVFSDKKDKEVDLDDNLPSWAAYVDIRIPSVRTQLGKEAIKPAFEDRLKWIGAILKASRLAGDVKEWILTLKWLVPRIRNEIHPNLMALAPLLLDIGEAVPRQFLDNATLDEAGELSTLYLVMDAQNAAAVTPAGAITHVIDIIAREALWRFADRPSHPFYHLGAEIKWRRQLTEWGESSALNYYDLSMVDPTYSTAVTERNEESEIWRRQLVAKEKEVLKTEGGSWGLYLIAEGREEEFVQSKLQAYHSRWLKVKGVMDPEVVGDDLQSFKRARMSVWQTICRSSHSELGWRWKRSPTLVSYLEETLDVLAKAPTKSFGQDTVLNWADGDFLTESGRYVQRVCDIYSDNDWLRANRDSLSWYTRFRTLRMGSTDCATEVFYRENECKLKNGEKDRARYEQLMIELLNRSPSAINRSEVRDFVSKERPDLLTNEQLGMTKSIPGLFNQVEIPEPWDLFLKVPSKLDPHQCKILKARHLLGMTDTSTPFQTRVQHAQAFVAIPTTTVEDVAKALCTPSLPSRIVEALLMFLPTLGEPASTLQLLLAPVYIQSHLARTSIHAVENALKCVPLKQVPDYILPLFPPANQRQQKVTVQKEGVRLACASMRLVADPKINGLINDLLAREDLNNDVRVVILQTLLRLLTGSEGREERYKGIVDWIWTTLAGVARSETLKKSGVALVLISVNPSFKHQPQAPRLTTVLLSHPQYLNATLNNLAKVTVPEALVTRYVEDILIPMSANPTEENKDDVDLIDVRILTLQLLNSNEGWSTTANASGMAKFWRREASALSLEEDDEDNVWTMSSSGIRHCVGKEVENALATGKDGNAAWKELVGLVQDQVDAFLDRTLPRALRKKALERINALQLQTDFVMVNFEKAKEAGVFTGDDLDLSRPLLGKAMESVTWKIALERELTVFRPHEGMTQNQINEEALRLLLRIADYSNRHLSSSYETIQWVGRKLLTKVKDNRELRRFIAQALINPCDDLIDWVHLNEVTEDIICNGKGVFFLSEISIWVERMACQDNAAFYWSKCTVIADLLASEVQLGASQKQLTPLQLSPITTALSPIIRRAQAAGWITGPDAIIVYSVVRLNTQVMCAAFPKEMGPLLHHNIAHSIECSNEAITLSRASKFTEDIYGLAAFGSQATALGQQGGSMTTKTTPDHHGLAPATVLIIEACLNGKLGELDLTPFMAPNNLPLEVQRSEWFRIQDDGDPKSRASKNPSTLKELEARWNKTMDTYSGYFKPLQKATEVRSEKNDSPVLRRAYQEIATNLISRYPKFVLMRPYVYLEFMCLSLTSPGSKLEAHMAANQLHEAFVTSVDNDGSGYSYAWAPPLSLGLDMAEYLLHKIREDAAAEGEREARLIEQVTASFLSKWMMTLVKSDKGKQFAEAEDIKTLEARYLALVEELCKEGSGGQNMALQLDDFVPGE